MNIKELKEIDGKTSRWFWMMDYCKKKLINPEEKWVWEEATKAYNDRKA